MFIYKTFTFFFKLLDVWESAGQGGGFLSSLSPGERSSMFNFFTNFASAVPSQKLQLPPSLHLLLLPLFTSSFTLLLLGHASPFRALLPSLEAFH